MTAVAVFDTVSKRYSTGLFGKHFIDAVTKVNLHVRQGEVFGLLGPNRAGKTTLAKMLLSLTRPTSGSILRLGEPVTDRRTLARVGYMHENHVFPRYLTATQLLRYYGALASVPPERLKQKVPELLQRVGLADRSNEPIAQFSKGMVQRLGLAQSIINEPDLLILDEPTEGLDLTARQMLREVMTEMREQGKTVLLISHALAEVEQTCDRVAVIVQGRLVHVGPLTELKTTSNNGEATLESALKEMYQKAPT